MNVREQYLKPKQEILLPGGRKQSNMVRYRIFVKSNFHKIPMVLEVNSPKCHQL